MLEPIAKNNGFDSTLLRILPPELRQELLQFLVDKRTGNFRIHVREGKILGYNAEKIVSLKP